MSHLHTSQVVDDPRAVTGSDRPAGICEPVGVNLSPIARRCDAAAAKLLCLADRCRAVAAIPLLIAHRVSDQKVLIDADASQWLAVLGADDGAHSLHSLLYAFPAFRGLFYYRLDHGNPTGALLGALFRHLFPPTAGLELLSGQIGPGLFIAHGQGTTIAAERMGRNCYVHQDVTIGWDYESAHAPVVGDGVFIGAGARILGGITIGDGARIGANAVVLEDVPAGSTAVGVPARIASAHTDAAGATTDSASPSAQRGQVVS
ncbi:MAG: serine O-acetyltransferase [Acidimicrobiales bacterium]